MKYQYGVRLSNHQGVLTTTRIDRRKDAESEAINWVESPLRTGFRKAEVLRRTGWDGEWMVISERQWPMAVPVASVL